MSTDRTLTSIILNPYVGSSNTIAINYSTLGFVASASDSYKSTAGDIFKVYVGGVRIYRLGDAVYATGKNFLEASDASFPSGTTNTAWVIDVSAQTVTLSKTAINGSSGSLYNSVAFTSGTTIIELRREVQDQASPAVDFSNASILTEQDLDNSSANVFHMSQQAVETANKGLTYNVGTSAYEAYQPGTSVKRKITQLADPVSDYDAVNKRFITTNLPNINTVAGISGNVTTVAGDSASVTLLATGHDGTASTSGTTDNLVLVNTVAGKATEIGLLGTSAMGHATTGHLARLGTADVVTDMGLLGATGVIDDMDALGATGVIEDIALLTATGVITDMAQLTATGVVADMALLTATGVIDDMDALGATGVIDDIALLTASGVIDDMALLTAAGVIDDMGLLGTADVVADMAILGTSDVVTDMNVLATADVVADMNVLATADVVADMNVLGTADVVTDMNLLATADVVADMALLAIPAVITDMDLLGATGVIADLAAVTATGVIADIETVADNVAGVNSFAERYRVASSAPTASLDEGDLYYNTTNNNVRYYNGTAWTSVGQTEAQSIVTADNSATAMAIALG
jgi:hypothetical protein